MDGIGGQAECYNRDSWWAYGDYSSVTQCDMLYIDGYPMGINDKICATLMEYSSLDSCTSCHWQIIKPAYHGS